MTKGQISDMNGTPTKRLCLHLCRLLKKQGNRPLLLMFDFDGTLAPIRSKPRLARLTPARRRSLSRLAKARKISVAIVTGRSLSDARGLVPVPGAIIAANHGCEILSGGIVRYPIGKRYLRPISGLSKTLKQGLKKIPGILVESKGFSVAVHYRRTPPRLWKEVKQIVENLSRPWRKKFRFRMTGGKRIWEIRPSLHWNKGNAALWIQRRLAPRAIPWYFGDDVTDEDAFKALRRKGITVFVGRPQRTRAAYRLDSVEEVWKLIHFLIKNRRR